MMNPSSSSIYYIPGMKVGCMIYEPLRYGNFECFFSETCLNRTARLISNLQPNFWPKPMNRTNLLKFSSNAPIEYILKQYMMETWNIKMDYVGYYNSCSPMQCTYNTFWRNNFIFVISRLIGLFGGLSVSLRLASPFIIKLFRYIYARSHSKIRSRSTIYQIPEGMKLINVSLKRNLCKIFYQVLRNELMLLLTTER